MRIFTIALAAAVVSAAADKPTPRQKARELLDGAAEMIAATHPDVQVAALFHLADNYADFDRKKALEYFKQAFTAAADPAVGSNAVFAAMMQMEIVVALTELDAGEGVAMLKLIAAPPGGYDVRSFAAARVVGKLVAKGDLDRAIQLAEYMGGAGAYPFEGVSQILGKLKPDDPRFAAVFSQALTAYSVKPDSSFARLLTRYYKDLPAGMPQTALSRILAVALDTKADIPYNPTTIASSKGTVTFTNRVENDLFDIMPLVRELDRKRYEELLAQHTEVRSALELFPGGGPSLVNDREAYMYTVSGGDRKAAEALNERQKLSALIQNRAMAALEAAASDPEKGLDLVSGIPSPPKQAEVLGRIAEMTGDRDPDTARRVLSKCVSLLDSVKYPDDRVTDWDIVAGAATLIKDEALAQRAIDKMLADAAEMYTTDADKDRPNRAWRENWPSTQALRRAVIRATRLHGVDAAATLVKITDPDQNVLARITMAQALLGRPFDRLQSFGRQHPPQTQ
ncbi:MAG: hypothetical protein JST11_07090 [Acidobacteria bacterium]|nr:hypothetical protein [Acidobacteriota bacterium]